MKELIKVTTNENNEQLVSGRELHEFWRWQQNTKNGLAVWQNMVLLKI